MIFAKIPQFEKFATYAEPFNLFSCRDTLPFPIKIIATYFSNTAASALRINIIEKVIILTKLCYLLLQIVNGTVKIVRAFLQHI